MAAIDIPLPEVGSLCRYLLPSDPGFNDALEIEVSFGIDKHFPAASNFVTVLIKYLKADDLDDSGSARRERWLATLSLIEARGSAAKWPRAAQTVRGGNPLGSQFKQYGVAALFLQPINHASLAPLTNLVKVCLCSLLANPREDIQAASHTLRVFIAKNPLHSALFKRLPAQVRYPEFRESLSKLLPTLSIAEWPSNEQNLVRALKKLSQLGSVRLPGKRPMGGDGLPTHEIPPLPSLNRPKGWRNLSLVDNWPDLPPSGLVGTIEITAPDAAEGEAPEFTTIFMADEQTPEDQATELPLSLAATDAAAEESRHWLSRHQRLVPGDLGRFTPLERKALVKHLLTHLHSPDNLSQVTAGLLGLMYCLAKDLDSVLNLRLGQGGDLDATGMFRRQIRQPTGAYVPPVSLSNRLITNQAYLELPLPPPLTEWVSARFSPFSGTIRDAIGISTTKIKESISDTMEALRDRSRFQRIRIERIPAALPLELTLATHDPAVTYLLAASTQQAAPMLSYYTRYPVEKLVRIYIEVTRKMMRLD